MDDENFTAIATPPRNRTGLRLKLLTFAALELWLWFRMAGLDYERGSLFPFTTSHWFALGQVFVIPFFGLLAWIATLLFERWPRVVATLACSAGGLLIGTSIYEALPQQRLKMLLGPTLARHSQVWRMTMGDSHGDGSWSDGFLKIEPDFEVTLPEESRFEAFQPPFDDYIVSDMPEEKELATNSDSFFKSKRLELRITQDGKTCFFHYSEYVPRTSTTEPP
jgi:hypothetical protein